MSDIWNMELIEKYYEERKKELDMSKERFIEIIKNMKTIKSPGEVIQFTKLELKHE